MRHLTSPDGHVPLTVIKRRAGFLRAAKGKRAASKGVVLQYLASGAPEDPDEGAQVGFTATKKIGSAVIRNRAKRRLREAARAVLAREARPGALYVLIARAETVARPYERLLADLRSAVARVHGERAARKGGS